MLGTILIIFLILALFGAFRDGRIAETGATGRQAVWALSSLSL